MGRIRTTFEVVTEESAAEGDAAERGWVDEEGEVLGVEAAIKWLRDKGPLEPSSSQFHNGIWYSGPSEQDMHTGEWYQEAYHLAGFTEAQQRRIYEGVVAARRKNPGKKSGYTPCRCRDCMEIAVSSDMRKPQFCSACKKAGCEDGRECRAAGGDDEGLEEFQRGIYDAVELNRPGRKNPHQQYYSDEDEDTERVRRLKAISDAVMARKNPKRRRR